MKTNSLFKRRFRGRCRRGMLNFLVSSSRRYPSMSKNCLNAEVHARRKYMSVRHWGTPHNQGPSTLMCFVCKRIHFDEFRPSVHTNALSVFIENASIWKRSWKWIKTKTHKSRISVDGQKRMKMKTMTENIAGACGCRMRIEFNLRHNVQFYRFLTFLCGQSKTNQNSSVDANWSMREFLWQRKRVSVDRASDCLLCAHFYVIIGVTWRINCDTGAILRYMLSFYKAKTWYWNCFLFSLATNMIGMEWTFFKWYCYACKKFLLVIASWWSCLIFSS